MSLVDPRGDSTPDRPGDPEAARAGSTCRDVVGLLLEYLEDALDGGTRAALERHFQDCGPCVAYLRTYDRTQRLAADVARSDAPPELPEKLKARLRQLFVGRLGVERF
jgi:anti-sigma factor RsiW